MKQDILGIVLLDKHLLGFIFSQSVVHVEPIELDLVQPQGSIDKNPEKFKYGQLFVDVAFRT